MKVSVIVGTKNRAHIIAACLTSIAAAISKSAPGDGEIIVVDNGSTDNTTLVIQNWAATCPVPVHLLFQLSAGLSASRNYAMRVAQGDFFVFTDDDCRLSEDYIHDLLRHDAADTEPVLRGGRVELGDPTDLTLSIKTSPDLRRWCRRLRSAKQDNLGAAIMGCNMALRREVAERIGPFDERIGQGTTIPAVEDTDWIYQAYLAGVTVEYVPDMVVYHHHGRKLQSEGDKLFASYAIGNGALYAKYLFKDSDLCRSFVRDVERSIRQFISGQRNYFLIGNYGFYLHVWLGNCVVGAIRYLRLMVSERLRSWFKPPVRGERRSASVC
ncbi:MAG: glycosyltransferase [Verrucomicrobia bacterium]|nr:glycosyltransferase [Verrucomicrobiota bacterium]